MDAGKNVLELGSLAEKARAEAAEAKKCGVGSGDRSLPSQPRLPGSVVGEASMLQGPESDKITRVTVRW